MRLSRVNTQYFPFAPGVPYQVKNGRYVLPELSQEHWQKALSKKEVVITAHAGLFESLLSCSVLEVINKLLPGKTLHWIGEDDFSQIYYLNGLATRSYLIDKEQISQYPVPLFFDADDRVYINCLHNYVNVYTYAGEYRYKCRHAVSKQLFQNSMVDWSVRYLPQLRNLEEPVEYKKWSNTVKFKEQRPYVLLFPEQTGLSQHDAVGINWTPQEVRSFVSMLKPAGVSVVLCVKDVRRWHGMQAYFPPFQLDIVLYLMSGALAVIARDVDFLLSAMLVSDAMIIANTQRHELDLNKNKKYLQVSNEIHLSKNMSPYQVFNEYICPHINVE